MAEIDIKELLAALANPALAVDKAEEEYEKKVFEVAKRVVDSDTIRVLLLAGPSGSGKTTTANLIADRIRALGEKSLVVSLDNFYMASTDPRYPRLPSGERDFESPAALDNEVIVSTLGNIINGEPFSVPRYDFKVGRATEMTDYESFSDGCVIVEGLHALNPRLSDGFDKSAVLKLFVSVSTNINEGAKRLLSGKKMRFVRRMVRDNIYRGADGAKTLELWPNVLAGEEAYLYPYKTTADIMFDTFHTFEGAVLKHFADKLLTEEMVAESPYARDVKKGIAKLPEYHCDIVPETSLIREFIPGGIYEDLY